VFLQAKKGIKPYIKNKFYMTPKAHSLKLLQETAKEVRKNILLMSHRAKSAHIGSALSTVDILVSLYCGAMRVWPKSPKHPNRDRFIMSKGWGVAAQYAVLAERNFFPKSHLMKHYTDGSAMMGCSTRFTMPGIEATTGSMGHGLSVGLGMALAAKHDKKSYRVFVMLSDGELDEGSVWEAVLSAAHFRADNLVAIVDYNKIQSFGRTKDVMNLEPLRKKWESFGWVVKEADGHSMNDLLRAFSKVPFEKGKPSVLIAHTSKGRGVSFMEDKIEWHYFNVTDELLDKALDEIENLRV